MSPIKTQIEVRFTNILDFNQSYRSIVSPYLKLAEFTIDNAGTYEENILLRFKAESIQLDIRWDRIVLISDGKPENLFTSSGVLFYFFQILEKFKQLDSFGEITTVVVAQWSLLEIAEKDTITELRKKYFKTAPPSIEGWDVEDLGIIYNFKHKNDSYIRLHFGHYNATQDIPTYNLSPVFNSKSIRELLRKKGWLSQVIIFEKSKDVDLELLKKIDKRITQILKQISPDEQ